MTFSSRSRKTWKTSVPINKSGDYHSGKGCCLHDIRITACLHDILFKKQENMEDECSYK